MKRIIIIAAVTIAAIIGFTFFTSMGGHDSHDAHDGHNHEEEEVDFDNISLTQHQVNTIDLGMGTVEQRHLDAMLYASGTLTLRAQSKAAVSSLMGGVVKSINVKEGQEVKKGTVVAYIENTDIVALQREYYSAVKTREAALREMQRQQSLQQNGAGVKKALQQAQTECSVAEANATGVARQLQQLGISVKGAAKGVFATVFPLRAPISGTVSRLTATVGSYADMQTPLMQINDNSAVEADINIFEKDLDKVKTGDRVLITLTNRPQTKAKGTIYGIGSTFTDGTKAVAAYTRIDTKDKGEFFDGMPVDAAIATGNRRCSTLPSQAIVSSDGKNYVFALNGAPRGGNYSFSRHEVTTGVSDDGFTEVKLCKHIDGRRKIVTKNAFYLASMTEKHGEHAH